MIETRDPGERLRGLSVLLVEDEYYIADDFRRTIIAEGASVIGPCPSLKSARDAIEAGGFEVAVLDLNLNGESAEPLARELEARGIPFAIATGYGSSALSGNLKPMARIEKPFEPSALVEIISNLDAARTAQP
jgi:DNA-binding NtrC family response regulator